MRIKMFTMKSLAILIIALLIGNTVSAQDEWELIFDDSEEFIRDMCFVPGDDGLWQNGWGITGYPESNIIKTTDGGDTWVAIEQTYSTLLASISFGDENTGYICTLKSGEDNPTGMILKSTDGGETWFVVHESQDDTFDKIQFKDPLNGVVTGYPSYYTEDGGDTWVLSNTSETYWQIDYAAGDTYFGVELGGDVGKTTDNGANWNSAFSTSPVMMGGIAFYDEMHGLIGGDESKLYVTHDGGDSWNSTQVGTGERFGIAIGAFDADIMYAGLDIEEIWMTTDGGVNWELDTLIESNTYREMVVTSDNRVYICGNEIGGGGRIWRKDFEVSLIPAFDASETIICAGSSVDFTDASYYNVVSGDWSLEGGTPSSTTDQNPTVTYNSGGLYDVTLTVTNEDGDTETLTQEDLIEVFETPIQPEIPMGDENLCTDNDYVYIVPALDYAQAYDWELSPSDAGSLTWDENEAYLAVSETWTGDFTIRVSASNFCGVSPWSDYFNGTISISPDVFVLQGGGSYCTGGEGVEITLDGSQEGVNYELYLEGEATGNIISGTGSAISFGMQTDAGIYEATAFIESCETVMSEQIEVVEMPLPTPDVMGLDMVCDEDVTDYETDDNAGSTYTWEVTGGTIIDGQGTAMVTIEWGEAGNGAVTVTEEDDNGCSATTEAFEVFIDDCTDINETGITGFRVYPNPSTNQLNVEFTNASQNDTRIIIYNHLGQIVLESELNGKEGSQSQRFDVSGLRNGLYIIKVQSSNGTTITKQIIKN